MDAPYRAILVWTVSGGSTLKMVSRTQWRAPGNGRISRTTSCLISWSEPLTKVQTIDYSQLDTLVKQVVSDIKEDFGARAKQTLAVYGVPRGGVPAALALLGSDLRLILVDSPELADFIFDDIIESGATRARFSQHSVPFYALIDKSDWPHGNDWVVWPWEVSAEAGITDHITRLLEFIGEDPGRGGLRETPARVVKAWQEWSSGYGMDPAAILKSFEDGATDEMVIERNIPFFSHCEHHMAPFFGSATIGYIPNKRVVGLSKMNRLVECFSRRLQVQERLTDQIADAMAEHLGAHGVGVLIKAQHMCVMSRGIKHAGCETITSALRGCMKERDARAEFMLLAK